MPIILNESDDVKAPVIPVIKDLPPPEEMGVIEDKLEALTFRSTSGQNTGLPANVLDQFKHVFGPAA